MFKDILVPVDLNDAHSWQKALAIAVELGTTYGARLHLVTVVPEFGLPAVGGFFPKDYEKKMREHAHALLRELAEKEVPAAIERQLVVSEGTIYREIIRAAKKTGCDLIVMGSHRPELKDYLLGPNAARVVRHARCSVMVVRD
jgi:nucleotide-binding universal stress UspA family protein